MEKNKNVRIAVVLIIALLITVGIIGFIVLNKDTASTTSADWQLSLADYTYIQLNGGYTEKKIIDAKSAIDSLNDIADIVGITEAADEFDLENEIVFNGCIYYRLSQKYESIPVYGNEIVVTVDGGDNAISLVGNYVPIDKIDLTPQIDKAAAAETVKMYFEAEVGVPADEVIVGNIEAGIYTDEATTLVWVVEAAGQDKEGVYYDYDILIDAKTGTVLNTATNIFYASDRMESVEIEGQLEQHSVTVNRVDDVYYMRNCSEAEWEMEEKSHIGIFEIEKGKEKIWREDSSFLKISSWNNGELCNQSAADAYQNITQADAFYRVLLNRDGWDNSGSTMHAIVGIGYDRKDKNNIYTKKELNAWSAGGFLGFYTPDFVDYINEKGIDVPDLSAYMDVIGHEYTHSVISTTAKLDHNLIPKTVNEAIADILGECAESYVNNSEIDWIVGSNGRNIKSPKTTSNPSNMSDYRQTDDEHLNSTIISHAAYLMWNGGEKANEWTPIKDVEKLSKLWYGALLHMNSTTTFSQCRNAVELSGQIMFAKGELTEEQCKTIISAFSIVGIKNENKLINEFIKNKFKLYVKGEDGIDESRLDEAYYRFNIHYTIYRLDSPRMYTKLKEGTYTKSTDLKLEDGSYIIILEDLGRDKTQEIVRRFIVMDEKEQSSDTLEINTDFSNIIVVPLERDLETENSAEEKTNQITWYKEPFLEADDIQPSINLSYAAFVNDCNPQEQETYDSVASVSKITQDGKIGLIDFEGEIKLEPVYSEINYDSMMDHCLIAKESSKPGEPGYQIDEQYQVTRKEERGFYQHKGYWYSTTTDNLYSYSHNSSAEFGLMEIENIDKMVPVFAFDEDLSDVGGALWMNDKTDRVYEHFTSGETKMGLYLGNSLLLPCEYDFIHVASEGIAAALKENKWYYINTKGEILNEVGFDHTNEIAGVSDYISSYYSHLLNCFSAYDFSEGFVAINRDGLWGYMNENGEEVIPCQFKEARPVMYGKAWVKQNGLWGILAVGTLTEQKANVKPAQMSEEEIFKEFLFEEYSDRELKNHYLHEDSIGFDNVGLVSAFIEDLDDDGKKELVTVITHLATIPGRVMGDFDSTEQDRLYLRIQCYEVNGEEVVPMEKETYEFRGGGGRSFPGIDAEEYIKTQPAEWSPGAIECEVTELGGYESRVSIDWNQGYLIVNVNYGLGGSSGMSSELILYSFKTGKQNLERYFVTQASRIQSLTEAVEGITFVPETSMMTADDSTIAEIEKGHEAYVDFMTGLGLEAYTDVFSYSSEGRGRQVLAILPDNDDPLNNPERALRIVDYTEKNNLYKN